MFRLSLNPSLKVDLQGARVTIHGGLIVSGGAQAYVFGWAGVHIGNSCQDDERILHGVGERRSDATGSRREPHADRSGVAEIQRTVSWRTPFGNVDVYVRDADGQVVGGLVGEFVFGWFSIHVLLIAEHLRGKGIGTTVLKAAEDTAIENGCHSASLDTMSFQAPDFYEKRGYVRIGAADGYPGGAQKIYMRKRLTTSAGEPQPKGR